MMKKEQINAIRSRWEATKGGEWEYNAREKSVGPNVVVGESQTPYGVASDEIGLFIVAAHNSDIPELLAEMDQLQNEVESLRDTRDRFADCALGRIKKNTALRAAIRTAKQSATDLQDFIASDARLSGPDRDHFLYEILIDSAHESIAALEGGE